MDGNEYSDLLVGAYNSDRVIYMRSRPVVQLNAVDISYNIKSKKMDLKTKSCTLLRRTPVACVPLTLCLEYSGQGVDGQQQFYIQCLESSTPKGQRSSGSCFSQSDDSTSRRGIQPLSPPPFLFTFPTPSYLKNFVPSSTPSFSYSNSLFFLKTCS